MPEGGVEAVAVGGDVVFAEGEAGEVGLERELFVFAEVGEGGGFGGGGFDGGGGFGGAAGETGFLSVGFAFGLGGFGLWWWRSGFGLGFGDGEGGEVGEG